MDFTTLTLIVEAEESCLTDEQELEFALANDCLEEGEDYLEEWESHFEGWDGHGGLYDPYNLSHEVSDDLYSDDLYDDDGDYGIWLTKTPKGPLFSWGL